MLGAYLLAVAAGAHISPSKSFGNWIAACDNVLHCEAVALPRGDHNDGETRDWSLHVSRGSGADAKPEIDIDRAFGWEGDPFALRVSIDGRESPYRFDDEALFVGDERSFLAAIASARSVTVSDSDGKLVGEIPVDGASAALRFIDDRQKRAGTVTAIVARGDRPASSIPAAPPLPRIAQPPVSNKPPRKLNPADIKAIQAQSDLCDPDRAEARTYRLDADHTVGIVGCMLGAYQGASFVVLIDERGRWMPAPIEQPVSLPKEAEPYDAYLISEGDYIEKERLLFMSAKGRGLNDCGEHATWAWDGKMFRLATYMSLDVCMGASINTRPSLWQTANDPLAEP